MSQKQRMMGEYLYKKFLENEIGELDTFITKVGMLRLLAEFEIWLERNEHLKS